MFSYSYKHLTRGLAAAAVLILDMGAAQPKLRAGMKMTVLVAKHGPPMFMLTVHIGSSPQHNQRRISCS